MNKELVAIVLSGLLAACGSTAGRNSANPDPCPNVVVLEDAARLIEFDGEQVIEDVAYTAEIVDINSACRYFDDQPINAEIAVDFAFGKGPKATEDQKVFKYFVAVTRTDREVIAKQEFVIPVNFSGKKTVVVKSEDIDRITIPRANESTSGLNFEIVVGISLTPAQVIYNRSGKSLKFPDLK